MPQLHLKPKQTWQQQSNLKKKKPSLKAEYKTVMKKTTLISDFNKSLEIIDAKINGWEFEIHRYQKTHFRKI